MCLVWKPNNVHLLQKFQTKPKKSCVLGICSEMSWSTDTNAMNVNLTILLLLTLPQSNTLPQDLSTDHLLTHYDKPRRKLYLLFPSQSMDWIKLSFFSHLKPLFKQTIQIQFPLDPKTLEHSIQQSTIFNHE